MNTTQNILAAIAGFILAALALAWAIGASGRARREALDEADGAERDSRGR